MDQNSHNNALGVVLRTSLNANNERTFKCLVICDKNRTDSEQNLRDQDVVRAIRNLNLFQPEGPCWHEVIDCNSDNLSVVTTKTLRIDPDKIMNDVKKREQPRFRYVSLFLQ